MRPRPTTPKLAVAVPVEVAVEVDVELKEWLKRNGLNRMA
jgi:hypothetical protein